MFNLKDVLLKNNILVSNNEINNFEKYREILLETNKFLNLTTITETTEMNYKHFLDSIIILNYLDLKKDTSLIDIGTGAGFPGLPLKIIRSDLKITLMDSLNKRIKFLDKVISELNLENINAIHGRAEELGKNIKFRENYDVAISRAVSKLNTLVEYALPFVKVGGIFISMKGPSGRDEVKESEKGIKLLGGKIEKIVDYTLDYKDSKRTLIIIKKVSKTLKKYPRAGGKPKSQPL